MSERNPVDQLVELFVYAPIGLLYERDDVLPKLVTRGRSQVQLARVLGQLALRQGQTRVEDRLGEALNPAGSGLARAVTDIGALVGLAPRPPARTASTVTPTPATVTEAPSPDADTESGEEPLPIAGYDELPARVIVALLVDLSPSQRQVVRRHEAGHRARTTILNQIDRLGT